MRNVIALVVVLVAAACGNGTPQDTGLPESTERCVEATPEVMAAIAEGLVIEDGELRFGRMVRSSDFGGDVWFVAAEIDAPGDLEADGDIGIWALLVPEPNSLTILGILPVETYAQESTQFPAENFDIVVTEFADGVRSSEACMLEALGF